MLFFIDESGIDHRESHYEVLAAVSIGERDLWKIIQTIQDAEIKHFGCRLSEFGIELKGKKLLKKKTFKHASQLLPINYADRTSLARSFLIKNSSHGQPNKEEFTAFAQSKIAFVQDLFDICASYGIKVFASIVDVETPIPDGNMLRKDYAYLFERIYYYLDSSQVKPEEHGLIVFDELDKTQSKILLKQMQEYFLKTYNGRTRSSKIVPEPFFVHSDLTTAIQMVDIIAYCLNWGFRLDKMIKPFRTEIKEFADKIFALSFKGQHVDEKDGKEYPTYGITFIDDLRPLEQRQ